MIVTTQKATASVIDPLFCEALADFRRRRYAKEIKTYFQTFVPAESSYGVTSHSAAVSSFDSTAAACDLALFSPQPFTITPLSWLSRIAFTSASVLLFDYWKVTETDLFGEWDYVEPQIPLYLYEAKDISGTISDLKNLFHESDSDGYIFKPTDYAFETAISFLIVAAEVLGNDFPRPHVVSDGEGGIRLRWLNDGRDLRLLLAGDSSSMPRLYHEAEGIYKIERDMNPTALVKWLRWLINDERSLREAA